MYYLAVPSTFYLKTSKKEDQQDTETSTLLLKETVTVTADVDHCLLEAHMIVT